MRKYLALLTLIFVTSFTNPEIAHACSGYGLRILDDVLSWAEIAVIGRFVEFDDAKLNGIFEVEEYLFGEVDKKYLVLKLNENWEIEKVRRKRHYSGDCGSVSGELYGTSTKSIFLLKRNIDGSYSWLQKNTGFYPFLQPSNKASVFFYNSTSPFRDFSEFELKEYIGEKKKEQPKQPLNTDYPLPIPALITTQTGGHYLLPIDGKSPVLLTDEELLKFKPNSACYLPPCTAYSPNGLDKVYLVQNETDLNNPTYFYGSAYLVGEAVVFSPTSETVAFWKNGNIQIFAFYYPSLGYGTPNELQLVNSLSVDNENYPEIVWTPDGRMLVYTDRYGLWLWDVFTIGSQPSLLVPKSGLPPIARYFSPMGRYIAFQEGKNYYNLDIVSGERLPDGVISFNDRLLLAFDTNASGLFSLRVKSSVNSPFYSEFPVYQAMWINEQDFLTTQPVEAGCGEEGGCWEDMDVIYKWTGGVSALPNRPNNERVIRGYQFDYYLQTEDIVSLIDAKTISLNGIERDLAGQIEGEIVKVEWLPSLFYYYQ